ncbi:MAG: S-layer homology domain-containing protein [Bacillota bacterium]
MDVRKTDQFYGYIAKACKTGIMQGYSPNTMTPAAG